MKIYGPLVLVITIAGIPLLDAQVSYQLEDGFRFESLYSYDAGAPFEQQVGGLALSLRGETIVSEGGEIRIHSEDGPLVLATFQPGVFGSFLPLDPGGRSVWFGESSHHNLYRVPLNGSGPELIDRIEFNFDMAFAPHDAPAEIAGKGFISGLGASPDNSLWLLDDDPETSNVEIVAGISPFSGPLTFDREGNLYLATTGLTDSRTGMASEKLVRFSAARIAGAIGGNTLQFADGETLRMGMEGFYNLAWIDGRLYGTSLGFRSGFGSIDVIDPAAGFTRRAFARLEIGEEPGGGMLYLVAMEGRAGFEPGAGTAGGILLASYGNYVDVSGISRFTSELYFLRGDANHDGEVDLSDAVSIIAYLFLNGKAPRPEEASDINADGSLDLADAVYLLNFLYRGGPQPPFLRV